MHYALCVSYTERLCCSQAKIQPLTASEHCVCGFIEILYPSALLSGGHNTGSSWAAPAPSPTAPFVHLHFRADGKHSTRPRKERTANKLSISQTFSTPDFPASRSQYETFSKKKKKCSIFFSSLVRTIQEVRISILPELPALRVALSQALGALLKAPIAKTG